MSDYISALRQDLVEAAEHQQRRSPARRATRPLHPRGWSPLAVLGAAAAVAAVLVVVMGLRAVEPVPRPTDAQIVTSVHIGGQPRDAVAVGSSLLIADYDGSVYRVSPADPRTRMRFDLRGLAAASLTAVGDAVWVVAEDPDLPPQPNRSKPPHGMLMKFDPRSGQLLARVPLFGVGDAIRAGVGGAWLPSYVGVGTGLVPNPPAQPGQIGAIVVAGRTAWTHVGDAAVQLDARGRILRRVHGISEPLGFTGGETILPDPDGAWVLGQSGGVLYRIDGNRVTRRITVGRSAGVLARMGTEIWATAISSPGQYEVVRVDEKSGKITGRVRLGRTAPQSLAPAGDQLWVVTNGGDALLISPE